MGRTDNCQVAVFASYATSNGHVLIDRRLFLPQEWADDPERREEAGVPPSVVFRTKPELALELVMAAVGEGLPFRWVGSDSLYGDSPTFVQGVRDLGKWYVLDTSRDARVWSTAPLLRAMGSSTPRGGRPRTRKQAWSKPQSIAEVLPTIPPTARRRLTVGLRSQCPRVYEYAE